MPSWPHLLRAMRNSYDRDDIPRVIVEEHLALRTASRWLLSFLGESPVADTDTARRRALHEYLESLRAELARHFEHEEREDGLCACHVGEVAFARLRQEHRTMLATLERLSLIVKTGGGPFSEPEVQGLDAFLALLARHEAEERQALEDHGGN